MTSRLRIFISHSSRDIALTKTVADDLGREDGYELLLDMELLESGREWEPYLHEWMADCDAGLLLLTEHSIQSEYVLKEATILAWRLSQDQSFRFFVARDPAAVSMDDMLSHGYAPVRLDRIQQIRSTDAGVIGDAVRSTLEAVSRGTTPFDRLVDALAENFAGLGDRIIGGVAEKLGVMRKWAPGMEEKRGHIQDIAFALLTGELGRYSQVADRQGGICDLIADLADAVDKERLLRILDLLAPHWVDAESASRVALLPGHEERRAVALNGRYVRGYTAHMYERRGHLREASKYGFLEVGGGNAGNLADHYTTQICEAYAAQPDYDFLVGAPQAAVIEEINNDRTRYVVIPPPVPGEVELVTLLDRFPGVNFILHTGANLDDVEDCDRIDLAVPPVDEVKEARMRRDYAMSRRTIREKGEL